MTDHIINPGNEAGAKAAFTSEMEDMMLAVSWEELSPEKRNSHRIAFEKGLEAAMATGALELRVREHERVPKADRIRRWIETVMGHLLMINMEQATISRRQLLNIMGQIEESAQLVLEDLDKT